MLVIKIATSLEYYKLMKYLIIFTPCKQMMEILRESKLTCCSSYMIKNLILESHDIDIEKLETKIATSLEHYTLMKYFIIFTPCKQMIEILRA